MRRISILFVFLFTLVVFSCSKEYTASVMFWYSDATASKAISQGVTELNFYVSDEFVGSQDASLSFLVAPQCGTPDLVTATKVIGKEMSQKFNVTVKDQNGRDIWYNNINFVADQCFALELYLGDN